jgi:Fe-S oxidoreductase
MFIQVCTCVYVWEACNKQIRKEYVHLLELRVNDSDE